LFVAGVNMLFGIPFFYYLLLPFFFISLRLQPRFVTLALVVTLSFAALNIAHSGNGMLDPELFRTELYLSVLACNFLIITALEEHRRANATRLSSQVSALENAVVRISSESQAKNDFIAILAHELRNPLTPVVSGIELLKLKNTGAEEKEVLASMGESMRTVRSLLNDLLDVSRISEGKISLNKRKTDIEPILNKAIMSTDHHRKDRHQNLVFKTTNKPLLIYGDPLRMEQVFSNLLTNASKYSDEGDTVTLKVREKGGFAEIEVIDEGIGIEPGHLHSIFDAFQQVAHGERTKEGLGIGLSLVRDFINMHEGTVRAESAGIGKGSRFIVRLPLSK
jgi:two-component system CheB/CheR fusion protein